jgi:hypothetical protein
VDALVTAAREPPPQDVTDQGKVLALWKRAGALAVGIDPSNDVLAIEFIGNGWTDLRSLVQDVYVVQVMCLSTETELLRMCTTDVAPLAALVVSPAHTYSLIHSLACSSSLAHTLAYLLATLFTLIPSLPRSLTRHSSCHTPQITCWMLHVSTHAARYTPTCMAIESVGEPPQLRRLFQDLQKMSSAIEVAMGAAVGDITVAGPPVLFAEYALPLRSGPISPPPPTSSALSSQMHDGAVGVAAARGIRPTSRRAGAGAGATAATGQAPVRVWTPMSHPRGEHEHDRERVHVLETAVVGWVSFTVWPAPHVPHCCQ